MPAPQKLLIDVLVTAAAVARRQSRRDDEPMVILFLLSRRRLVALKAVHAFSRVLAHFVFVDDRILRPRVAFRAFPSGTHELGPGLLGLRTWPGAIDEKRGENESEGNHGSYENRSKRHSWSLSAQCFSPATSCRQYHS
jgi:hypothetical protein